MTGHKHPLCYQYAQSIWCNAPGLPSPATNTRPLSRRKMPATPCPVLPPAAESAVMAVRSVFQGWSLPSGFPTAAACSALEIVTSVIWKYVPRCLAQWQRLRQRFYREVSSSWQLSFLHSYFLPDKIRRVVLLLQQTPIARRIRSFLQNQDSNCFPKNWEAAWISVFWQWFTAAPLPSSRKATAPVTSPAGNNRQARHSMLFNALRRNHARCSIFRIVHLPLFHQDPPSSGETRLAFHSFFAAPDTETTWSRSKIATGQPAKRCIISATCRHVRSSLQSENFLKK